MIQTQTIEAAGYRVSVNTTEARDHAIIFLHGNSSSAASWLPQLSDPALSAACQLISYDLPGHGASARCAAYDLRAISGILPELVAALGLRSYVVVGLSLGTALAAEAAPALPGCRGYFMISPNVVGAAYPPDAMIAPSPYLAAMGAEHPTDEILDGFVRLLTAQPSAQQAYRADYLATDPAFRLAVMQFIVTAGYSDETSHLQKSNVPVCFVFGADERAIQAHYLDTFEPKWQNQIFRIPAAAHFSNLENTAALNALLAQFATAALGVAFG